MLVLAMVKSSSVTQEPKRMEQRSNLHVNLEDVVVMPGMMAIVGRTRDEARAKQPAAGGLFAIDVGVKGLPEARYAY